MPSYNSIQANLVYVPSSLMTSVKPTNKKQSKTKQQQQNQSGQRARHFFSVATDKLPMLW
ncbi:hypothetical protein ACRRTK_007841 [Alexandromys fortis]